jgi:peptide/nickel transport system ATP-binding protein
VTMPLLDVCNLSIAYSRDGAYAPVVHDVSFSVRPGEVVALVGESGSGKSTTAYAIAGLLASNAAVTTGTVLFEGVDLVKATQRQLASIRGPRIGFIPQDPVVSLDPLQRVGRQVSETLRIHKLCSPEEAWTHALDCLAKVGFAKPAEVAVRYPHQLSGGMLQRILISMAMSCAPPLIIADEPTSALDVTVQRIVLDHLSRLRRENGSAMLLITHELAVAAERAHKVIVLNGGRVVEFGTVAEIFDHPSDAYTRKLINAIPGRQRSGAVVVRRRALPPTAPAPLVVANGLIKDYPPISRGGAPFRAVDDISFEVPRCSTLGIVGESGSGKSTTARMVMMLVKPTSGSVSFDGIDLTALKPADLRQMRRHIQIVQQNPFASLDPRFTVRQILEEPLRSFGVGTTRERQNRVAELLTQVALPLDFARRQPAALSGGQRQRVAIARALALRPRLVVLDEAVSALDVSVQAGILDLLQRLQHEEQLTYIFISHNLAVIQETSDRVLVLRAGRLIEAGPTERVFRAPQAAYTAQLLAAMPSFAAA